MTTQLSHQPTHHGYAVNVKDYGTLYADHETAPLTEEEVQAVYDYRARDFWDLVQEVATDHGFAGAYSEGRSSGWCQPYPQPDRELSEEELAEWMAKTFRPFERDVLDLMSSCREEFVSDLTDAVETAKREPIERAYWESRDVRTVDA